MSDRHSFSSDNFYVGSDNVRCPTVILSTDLVMPQNLYSLAMDAQNLHLKMPSSDSDLIIALVRYIFCQCLIQKKGILISQGSFAI